MLLDSAVLLLGAGPAWRARQRSVTTMNEIDKLQEWYRSRCDGEWEEQHGITITSCDNPGWWVKIDLAGTPLETKPFETVAQNVSPQQIQRIAAGIEPDRCDRGPDWLLCEVEGNVFSGAGDPGKLRTIVETFLNWAEGG
jgi:hypothetical protein